MDCERCKHEFERHPALGPAPEKSAEEQLRKAGFNPSDQGCMGDLTADAFMRNDGKVNVYIPDLTPDRAVAALLAARGKGNTEESREWDKNCRTIAYRILHKVNPEIPTEFNHSKGHTVDTLVVLEYHTEKALAARDEEIKRLKGLRDGMGHEGDRMLQENLRLKGELDALGKRIVYIGEQLAQVGAEWRNHCKAS